MSQAVADRVSSWLTALHALRDDAGARRMTSAVSAAPKRAAAFARQYDLCYAALWGLAEADLDEIFAAIGDRGHIEGAQWRRFCNNGPRVF